jgi:hypothetical protein
MQLKQRVEIPAYTDRWMMGDRFGRIVKVTKHEGNEIAHVKLEISGKTTKVLLDHCTPR